MGLDQLCRICTYTFLCVSERRKQHSKRFIITTLSLFFGTKQLWVTTLVIKQNETIITATKNVNINNTLLLYNNENTDIYILHTAGFPLDGIVITWLNTSYPYIHLNIELTVQVLNCIFK